MNQRNLFRLVSGLLLTAFAAFPAAAKQEVIIAEGQESVVFDTETGNYVFTYLDTSPPGELGEKTTVYKSTYVPRNKIDPEVRSSFGLNIVNDVIYRYALKNREKEKNRQSIMSFGIHATSLKGTTFSTNTPALLKPHYDEAANLPEGERGRRLAESLATAYEDARKAAASTPAGWEGSVRPGVSRTGVTVWWHPVPFEEAYGLVSGRRLPGFGFTSQDLPGVGTAVLRGYAPVFGWKNRGGPDNDAVRWVANDIMKKRISVERYVAVPTIIVPNPFDAAVLLERLQKHAKVDLTKFQLIDPVFATQLDPWFAAAIDAARRNNSDGVRHQIKEIRRLIKQEQPEADRENEDDKIEDEGKSKPVGRIDRFAARVLDFDLKYVEKRLEDKK